MSYNWIEVTYRCFFHSWAIQFSLFLFSIGVHAQGIPEFTQIVRLLLGQSIQGGRVLLWDHMAADSVGLKTKPGRPGNPVFEQSVFELVGVTIAEGSPIIRHENLESTLEALQEWEKQAFQKGVVARILEVEMDHHGGSGRSAYLRIVLEDESEIWVNIKGVGVTGVGVTALEEPSPPKDKVTPHGGGGARMSEGITEFFNGLMAHNELKYGGSRVIGVLTLNTTTKIKRGQIEPLVVIVREPLRRMDQSLLTEGSEEYLEMQKRIPEAFGQANAKRIMKGDFVNRSNVGSDGTFIDYGLISITNGFVPASNYLKVMMFEEMDWLFKSNREIQRNYRYSQGFYLLNQLGLEEGRIQEMVNETPNADKRLVRLANLFRELVYSENASVLLDDVNINIPKINGNFRIQELFGVLLYEILMGLHLQRRDALPDELFAKAKTFVKRPSKAFESNFLKFVKTLIECVESTVKTTKVADVPHFAVAMKKVAEFKNRSLLDFVKPNLFKTANQLAQNYLIDSNPIVVLEAVNRIVRESKLGTSGFTTPEMQVSADAENSYIFLKAWKSSKTGEHRLMLYPALPLARESEDYLFEIVLDESYVPYPFRGRVIETRSGNFYYRIDIPHGKYPVTAVPMTIRPRPVGRRIESSEIIEILAPPLFLNERLGLMPDFTKVPSEMRSRYQTRIGSHDQDFVEILTCEDLLIKY